jgi:hypothetical protein
MSPKVTYYTVKREAEYREGERSDARPSKSGVRKDKDSPAL